ncbi:MAG TPA: Arm DNA-binding domain-containing protein [Bacteroidales bacterium]|nr:Arm DNA-binding domain-containing protein [Bacteroidales bacterium]
MITRSRVALLFYIKRTKLHQNGEAPIFLKIKVDKQSAEFSIMKSVAPTLWSVEKNGATSSTKEAKEVNNYINLIRHQVNEHLSAMRDNGCTIIPKGLKNAFLGI